MQYIRDIDSYESNQRTAVTLGKFDGFHRGHQLLVEKIKGYASEHVRTVVVAFDMGKPALLTPEEKRSFLEQQTDCFIYCPFTKEIREMEAEDFIRVILAERLKAAYIAVGTDFRFGYGKRGDVSMLREYADVYGYKLDVIEKKTWQGEIISSTYIRESLRQGDVSLTNALLGYPYHITGMVEHGKCLGRTIGFPTMNVAWPEGKIPPRFGVYACGVILNGRKYCGVGNIGVKPTVTDENRVLAEVYVFDYEGDAYGQEITVELYEFERPERKFTSVEELKQQLEKDKRFAREYFSALQA